MIICVAGDIHGAMDRLYQDVLAFEPERRDCSLLGEYCGRMKIPR